MGCVYPDATNYDSTATTDDGSCVFLDITSNDQEVYDGAYTDGVDSVECPDITSNDQEVYDGAYADGAASVPENTCPADLDNDGVVTIGDLLVFLGEYGNICE